MNYALIADIFMTAVNMIVMTALAFIFIFSLPAYAYFISYRRMQVNRPDYDALANLPVQVALTTMFSAVYGIIFPTLMFLAVRSHQKFGPWEFIDPINTRWKIVLASIAMIWLAARLIGAGLNLERPRFAGWLDRAIAGLGLFVCLHYHLFVYLYNPFNESIWLLYVIKVGLPHIFILGATLVYLFALIEACRRKEPVARRKRRAAWAIAAAAILIPMSPLWLTVPRVTHRQAMNIIQSHLDLIRESANAAEIDPRLLAGFIYVAQTREKSMFSGTLTEKFQLAILKQEENSRWIYSGALPNPLIGVLPMTCGDQMQILNAIETTNGFEKYATEAALSRSMSFIAQNQYSRFNTWQPEAIPGPLVDLIQSSASMDHIFNSFIIDFEAAQETYLTNLCSLQADARKLEMAMPTLPYLFYCSRYLRAFTDCSFEEEDEMYEEEMNSAVPVITDFIEPFPEFAAVRARDPSWPGFSKYFYFKESVAIIEDGEMSIPLGAAMIKMFEKQVRDIPASDRIFEIVRRSPYARPNDFATRLKKIMHSTEFDRLFGPDQKMEASR